ncbi:uncharacterized protein LOC141685160 [Apium graveolens]|uniref:uncharacterized protein LOC141685160 n=1 Tax=Apium graveolens TaxID=4045 RepID=UPI003D791445
MHFEGNAGVWFRYYQSGRVSLNWKAFINDVVVRFENSENRDVLDLFNKLRQDGTVMEYEDKFEELRSMIVVKHQGFSEEYFVSSFVSGLKDHIKGAIRMFRPQTLSDEVFLAKQEESRHTKGYATGYSKTNVLRNQPTSSNATRTFTFQKPTISSGGKDGYQNKARSILSSKEILERREKGQCFHCDDKYHPGQNCKARLYLLTGEEHELSEGWEEEDTNDALSTGREGEDPGEISLNALVGNNSGGTLRFQGIIRGKKVSILIDSGSTHSFVDVGIVKTLGLTAEMVSPLLVTVADVSRQIPERGKWISLQGDAKEGQLQTITGKQLSKIFKASKRLAEGYLCMVTVVPTTPIQENQGQEQLQPQLQQMIDKFSTVFTEPSGLPPSRPQNHKIPLLQGSEPVNQRGYRVPFIQKTEIERQVKEMLNNGIIQESTSPFASPIILVKKKDGSWRMCVDYRRLNNITIKNKYPIPIIDELLDELRGASWFTKLDLRPGYHQVRVATEDVFKIAFRTHQGLYEFKVMPFGLTNAPATFQALMNSVFQEQIRKTMLVFFDDILVYSKSLEEHVYHLHIVLQKMVNNSLFAKRSKCQFGRATLEYLGHIISA